MPVASAPARAALPQRRHIRQRLWHDAHPPFDVAIVGGGAQGACLFAQLAGRGRRVLLIDRGDFAGGTSQASAMQVWGGLLYLKNLDLLHVIRLSASRDRLLKCHPELAERHRFSLVLGRRPHRRPWALRAGLWTYWLLGACRREAPRHDRAFAEQAFLAPGTAVRRLRFEEGQLRTSDARFVLDWIARSPGVALNYCKLIGGGFDRQRNCWRLELRDALDDGNETEVEARHVVNAAGAGAEGVDNAFGVRAPWKHLFAKGVSFCIRRPEGHHDTLVFDGAGADDGMSLVPWGPVSLWGSTETLAPTAEEARRIESGDVDYLLATLNARFAATVRAEDIISLRCGVRALAVPRGTAHGNPLQLSKRWFLHHDRERRWVSIYGGKLTSCIGVASRVCSLLGCGPPSARDVRDLECIATRQPQLECFPGLAEPVFSPDWCRAHESCCTLEDYLRRRTNIAQWVPRGGLGRANEHRPQLVRIATCFCDGDAARARAAVEEYEFRVAREHDAVLGTAPPREVVHV
jgi:glycerol-3-phosphate dehydrogenase